MYKTGINRIITSCGIDDKYQVWFKIDDEVFHLEPTTHLLQSQFKEDHLIEKLNQLREVKE